MGAHPHASANLFGGVGLWRADYGSGNKPNYELFGSTALKERLRRGASLLLGRSATTHRCATVAFASLLVRRVRHARCGWQLQGRYQHRQHDCEQDGCCFPHWSTIAHTMPSIKATDWQCPICSGNLHVGLGGNEIQFYYFFGLSFIAHSQSQSGLPHSAQAFAM